VEEQTDIDLLKLRLEERRVEGELRLREADLVLKRDEFEAKKIQENQKQYLTFSPLVTGIIAAIVGLIGTAVGSYMQGRSQLEIERLKFESNLILKAVETGDSEKAKNNLLFMLGAGFIQDKDGKISALAKKSENVPVLPSASLSQTTICPEGARRVSIATQPSSFDVFSDTSFLGKTPWGLCAPIGQHLKFTLSRYGYVDREVNLVVTEHENDYVYTPDRARSP
jgi:hypothetical protein